MNGFWKRVAFAFRCFFSILLQGELPNDFARRMKTSRSVPGPASSAGAARVPHLEPERAAPETFDRAVQILALLQRDVPPERADAIRSFGESLPPGLQLVSSANCMLSVPAFRDLDPSVSPEDAA
jgi:hypothetical protein